MHTFDSPEVLALIEHYSPAPEPRLRLCDLETIGFVIGRSQSHPDPTCNMPAVGQVLEEALSIDELMYGGVMSHLVGGTTIPMSPAPAAKLRRIFEADDRYSNFELIIDQTSSDCALVSLVKKADQP